MTETKQFPTRVLLTVTTGRLLTAPRGNRDNGIRDLYDILEWMTGDSAFTHQLPRFGEECKPWLLRWFSELETVDVAHLDRLITQHGAAHGVDKWLESLSGCRSAYDVPRIPQDDHEHKDPYDELVQMRGTDEGIVLLAPPDHRQED
jgi:hypothetical protein